MDLSAELQAQVRSAYDKAQPLRIRGGGSKDFYGCQGRDGHPLDVAGHQGIIDYEPAELFITVRAGTPLQTLHDALAAQGQRLAFEPPAFGPSATIGGALACGLSGPGRPFTGAARDHVLGVRLLNGRGDDLRFGGQVMKNVAGYDVSRLMVGALGTLGVLLDVSLKVLPRPPLEWTLIQEADAATALERFQHWARQALPWTGMVHWQGRLYLRLAGTEAALTAAQRQLGGEQLPAAAAELFWSALREQKLTFFAGPEPLWRLALPPATPPLPLDAPQLLDWGGAQRWLRGPASGQELRALLAPLGGHATRFRGHLGKDVFTPLAPALLEIQQRLKAALDPRGILNPGRLYPEL